jgi:multidrug efflux pump subunit AcrB
VARQRENGVGVKESAIRGAAEIGLPAIVITFVIVAVFLPVAFLPGIIGKFMFGFSIDIVVATITSLLISFSVTPSLAGNWSLKSTWKAWPIIDAFNTQFDRLSFWYVHAALPWGIRHPKTVIGACIVAFCASVALVPLGFVGAEFIPAVDRGEFTVQLTMPPGTAIASTSAATVTLERYIDTHVTDLARESAVAGSFTSQLGVVNQGNARTGRDGDGHSRHRHQWRRLTADQLRGYRHGRSRSATGCNQAGSDARCGSRRAERDQRRRCAGSAAGGPLRS